MNRKLFGKMNSMRDIFHSPNISSSPNKNATTLWYDSLVIFYENMPRSRHWKLLIPYDNSFTGKKALDFLTFNLPSISGKAVTRDNCRYFLIMFLLNKGLIVNARDHKDLLFDEDKIYQFNHAKVNQELYKTSNSSFNSSLLSHESPAIRRARLDNNENLRYSPLASSPSNFASQPRSASDYFSRGVKSSLFASFRRIKKSTIPASASFSPTAPRKSKPSNFLAASYRKRDLPNELSVGMGSTPSKLRRIF